MFRLDGTIMDRKISLVLKGRRPQSAILLHAGNETGGSRGSTDDDKEEFPGECSTGQVELDEGGEEDPFEDVDDSSVVDIL